MKPTLFSDLRDKYIEELATIYASDSTPEMIDEAKRDIVDSVSVDAGHKLYLLEHGFVIYSYWVDTVWIAHLYVEPEYRKTGLASNMLDDIQKLEGYPLALYCHQNNIKAQAFYEKIGFTKPRLAPNYNFDNNKFNDYILYRRDNITNGFIADLENEYKKSQL